MNEQQILQSIDLEFARAGVPPRVYAKQWDNNMRVVACHLYNDNVAYNIPGGYKCNVRAQKPDGHSVYNPALSIDGNTAYIVLTQQMLAASGTVLAEIEIARGEDVLKTQPWQINVEASPAPEEAIESTDEFKTVQALLAETLAAKEKAETAAELAQQAKEKAKEAADSAAEDAKKVIDEGVTEKLERMEEIQGDVTTKASQAAADTERVRRYAEAAQYLIGYDEKNILSIFILD